MKLYFILLMLCSSFLLQAQQNYNIVPLPVEIKPGKGHFVINANTFIVSQGSGLENSVTFFNDYIFELYGFRLKTVKKIPVKM